ncbi:ABC-F family ATP-binding cassette domain-containing protein [candidate division KSB1 bacterium]|nr:ABC-F family ATP-binding cassette domain-containing protein [candidate division KSB1 bacterium]
MNRTFIEFSNMSFTYASMATPLFEDISLHIHTGWTGVVGANGAGKSTLLKLASRKLQPDTGFVTSIGLAVYCPQRTDNLPADCEQFISSTDADAYKLKQRFGIDDGWPQRWDTLSHGERKRLQVAIALWRAPDVLAIDEPTNHLDAHSREFVRSGLQSYRGIGLLVSHDRTLLNSLCKQCLFVQPPNAVLRSGTYNEAMHQAELEQMALQRDLIAAKGEYKRLIKTAATYRHKADQADSKKSKRKLNRKDHDGRAKMDAARVTGKDAIAGKQLRQLEGRLAQASEKMQQMKSQMAKSERSGIWINGQPSRRSSIIYVPQMDLPLGGKRVLKTPGISINRTDRIGLTGVNGSGKSTLVRHIVNSLDISAEQLTYLPQEIDANTSSDIIQQARQLSGDQLGQLMTIVCRLGSLPERLLESVQPSPGEVRKLLLALGIVHSPQLIIMDEPTNHLDLPSIECLEHALTDCPCALLLVSHDEIFLEKLTTIRWRIEQVSTEEFYLKM